MSEFILNNKLSRTAHFELGECPVFDLVPESCITPMPVVLEDRIGSEMLLLLIDKTPFIYTLAKVKPFDLMLHTGMVETSHGPLAFLLFYVPRAGHPLDPYFAHDYHLNPFDVGVMATWRDLARQSHWHVILIDAERQVQDVLEFENVYGLGNALSAISDAVNDIEPGDFALAKLEFCEQYSLLDLLPA
jgi:hypothetical protein